MVTPLDPTILARLGVLFFLVVVGLGGCIDMHTGNFDRGLVRATLAGCLTLLIIATFI